MTPQLFLVPIAYVLGATPTSHWIARAFYGVDLRKEGSGNLGATNTYRVLGWRAAVPVVIIDVLKGWAPTAAFPLLAPGAFQWTIAYGAAAILGHVFSFWIGFCGGKGVATSAGVFAALTPMATLIALGVWLGVVSTTGYVSLGSILGAVALATSTLLIPPSGGGTVSAFTIVLAGFILWAHRGNVVRLVRGEERRFGKRRGP